MTLDKEKKTNLDEYEIQSFKFGAVIAAAYNCAFAVETCAILLLSKN